MIVKVADKEYINLDLVARFKIDDTPEAYKLTTFSTDGKISGVNYFFKNNDMLLKYYNDFISAISSISYNNAFDDEGLHYVNDREFEILQDVMSNPKIIAEQFEYNDGIVQRKLDGSCYYIKDNEVEMITEEQYKLYFNVAKTLLNKGDEDV